MYETEITQVVTTPGFRRQAKALKVDDLVERAVKAVRERPDAGTVIKDSGGLRKLRISLPGKGKRGGARILYVVVVVKGTAYLLGVLAKSKKADFSPAFIKAAAEIAKELKDL